MHSVPSVGRCAVRFRTVTTAGPVISASLRPILFGGGLQR